MSFNPADYASVQERLPLFWKDCPRGRINTEIVTDDGTRIIVRADLYADITDAVLWLASDQASETQRAG